MKIDEPRCVDRGIQPRREEIAHGQTHTALPLDLMLNYCFVTSRYSSNVACGMLYGTVLRHPKGLTFPAPSLETYQSNLPRLWCRAPIIRLSKISENSHQT